MLGTGSGDGMPHVPESMDDSKAAEGPSNVTNNVPNFSFNNDDYDSNISFSDIE